MLLVAPRLEGGRGETEDGMDGERQAAMNGGGYNSCDYLCAAVANERPPAAAAAAVPGFMKTHIKVQRGRGGERVIGCVNQECKTHHQLYVQVL